MVFFFGGVSTLADIIGLALVRIMVSLGMGMSKMKNMMIIMVLMLYQYCSCYSEHPCGPGWIRSCHSSGAYGENRASNGI